MNNIYIQTGAINMCEHCGMLIDPTTAVELWVGDITQPNAERLAKFCNDGCTEAWWNAPENEGVINTSEAIN